MPDSRRLAGELRREGRVVSALLDENAKLRGMLREMVTQAITLDRMIGPAASESQREARRRLRERRGVANGLLSAERDLAAMAGAAPGEGDGRRG